MCRIEKRYHVVPTGSSMVYLSLVARYGVIPKGTDRIERLPWLFDEKWITNNVMAISVISVSSDSSEDSVGTPARRVILFESLTASGALRHRVMVLVPGQPIPHGQPYHYHLNGPLHMMTARKRVGPMPTHLLAERHSVDYSSSDHFSSDDSSSSSSRVHHQDSSDSLLMLYLILHLVIHLLIIHYQHHHRDESSEPSRSRGTDLEMDVDVERSNGIEIDPEVQAEINECIAYADALRDRGIDAREGAIEVTTMPNTRSGVSRTREGVNEQSDHRIAEALRVRDAIRNLGPLMGDEGENGGNGNGGNGNGGNGNGNGNGGEYGYNFRGFMPARGCKYQDFLKLPAT
ncbi:hypothetical protein Tco_0268865 [Tanacetum coccineum]